MKRLLVGAALILAAGCQPHYDGAVFRVHNGSGDVQGSRIEIIEGQALIVSVRLDSSNPFEDYEEFNIVSLEALDQTVVFAGRADELDRFVLVGAGIGRTTIDLLVDDRLEDTLDAEVVAQPEAP